MRANQTTLLKLIKKTDQFAVPIYQRTYSWGERQCWQLWSDIIRAGESADDRLHFMGSVVYIEEQQHQNSGFNPALLIDGQQRLTTIMLIFAALATKLGDHEIEEFTAERIRSYYLINNAEKNERRFKLLLTKTDRESLIAIIEGGDKPVEHSEKVHENYGYFKTWVSSLTEDKLKAVFRGIGKLLVIDVALERGHDDPQLIFESMNSTGLALSQADLIRNYVLMGLEPNEQERLYKNYWQEMEKQFGQQAYRDEFDKFMRHYLTVKTGEIPKINAVYEVFKGFSKSSGNIEDILSELKKFADYYCRIALSKESDNELKKAFDDLRELKVEVSYPFILELYQDYENGMLSRHEFLESVRMAESYVFRRAVCSIPTNSLNKTFAMFSKEIKKDRYVESIKAHFLNLPSYRRFPSDKEFRREIQIRNLYNFHSRSYWLNRMENFNRKERVSIGEYTIEHILPQNPDLPEDWRQELGDEWKRVQEERLHTLGNLTLTGYNSEYQDKPFLEKRNMEGGFSHSPLNLNEGLGQIEVWDEDAIRERARKLARKATEIWTIPKLPEDILALYRHSEPKKQKNYTLDDHPMSANVRQLFETLQKELIALDNCVEMEVLKIYIAFKAEKNFVEVAPLKKQGLKLYLNIDYAQLHDPDKLCRDMTGIGHWGTGDVEFTVERHEDIKLAVGFARQALELQLGDTE